MTVHDTQIMGKFASGLWVLDNIIITAIPCDVMTHAHARCASRIKFNSDNGEWMVNE